MKGEKPAAMPVSITIPVEFWESLRPDQLLKALRTSEFDAEVCRALWKHLGRSDPPWERMQVRVFQRH